MADSVCCPPETITALLISYTFIETKKASKKELDYQEKELAFVNASDSLLIYFDTFSQAVAINFEQEHTFLEKNVQG